MQPIQDISDLRPGHVLFHSAFGFARVEAIRQADVLVGWEKSDRNLPRTVARDTLRRVYSLCRPSGFFERALLDPDGLQLLVQTEPLEALALLLEDLSGPQSAGDVQEWLVTLDLLPAKSFDGWWQRTEDLSQRDERFRQLKGLISLKSTGPGSAPIRQLDDPLLSPARRLDLVLELRGRIPQDDFREHVCAAWRAGGTQVRELALQAVAGHHPNLVLAQLLSPGPDNAEALIHALRRAGWQPDQFDPELLDQLILRVRDAAHERGLIEQEGRLAAAVARWWPDGGIALLVELAGDLQARPLVRAALEALPDQRAEALHLAVLAKAIDERLRPAASWLSGLLIDDATETPTEIADRIESSYALIARWLRENELDGAPEEPLDDAEDAPLVTMEVELVPLGEEDAMALGDLPRRSGRTLIALAAAMTNALAAAHAEGTIVNPTNRTFVLNLDGSVELRLHEGDADQSPRPDGEPPSIRADLYASAVLMLETLLGRVWPRNLAAERVLPYLRHIVPDLPPSAMAPFDQALHPNPEARPPNAGAWLRSWRAVSSAEARRSSASGLAQRPLFVGYDTHIGLMKMLGSQTNQDALAVNSRDGVHLLCVCDGISTANAGSGDVASGTTVNVISSLWEQNFARLHDADDFSAEAFIERALALANRAVCQHALQYAHGDIAGRVPMGTTVVVAVIRGSRVQLGWLGDSRAYLIGPYGGSLITADMNQASERLKSWFNGNTLSWDPAGYALVGYIGHFNEELRPEPLVPSQVSLTLLPGERLVLCTDGVTDYISTHHPGAVEALYHAVYGAHPADAATQLTAAANRGGGGDNSTAIVATLLPAGEDETEEIPE